MAGVEESDSEEDATAALLEAVKMASESVKAVRAERSSRSAQEAMEKALAGPAEEIPAAHQQVYDAALDFLTTRFNEGVDRALVLVADSKGRMVRRADRGIENDHNSETCARLLEKVAEDWKPILLVDAQQDVLFGENPQVKANKLRSVVCVPFGPRKGAPRGILYADNRSEKAVFSHSDLKLAEACGESVVQGVREADQARRAGGRPQLEEVPTEAVLHKQVGAGCAAFLLIAFLMMLPGMRQVAPEATPTVVPPNMSARPITVADHFLKHLRENEFGEARDLLSRQTRAEWSEERLEAAARRWSSESQSSFQGRRGVEESFLENLAVVHISNPQDTSIDTWTWRFIKQSGSWKLQEPKGRPFQ